MIRIARAVLLLAVLLLCSAHVGSPDAWFEGTAGPYPVTVHIEAPGVIPGVAVVKVQVEGAATRVTAGANRFDATGGAPPPEIAEPVEGQRGLFRAPLWIMTSGSYSITVSVEGSQGKGTVVVPLTAFPIQRLGFSRNLALILGAAGIVLIAGLLTIVGAGVREAVLAPGAAPDPKRRLRARVSMVGAGAALGGVLVVGRMWWNAEDSVYARSVWKPMASGASVADGRFVFEIQDSLWIMRNDVAWLRGRGRSPAGRALTSEHGKLMHLFVVDAEKGEGFAHLHPETTDSVRFTAEMPPLPPGRYTVFADLVELNGFAQTAVASLEVPGTVEADKQDPRSRDGEMSSGRFSEMTRAVRSGSTDDDGWTTEVPRPWGGPPVDRAVQLGDGSELRWKMPEKPIVAGEEAGLRFAIEGPTDLPPLEPYLGMTGHAVVVRNDSKVFIHLHPMGTVSPAAMAAFSAKEGSAPVAMAEHGMSEPAVSPSTLLYFPYAFPEPGTYHVWVQVKRAGQVLTGGFDAVVKAPTP